MGHQYVVRLSSPCPRSRIGPRPQRGHGRPAGEVSDEEVLAILAETRPRMQRSAADGMQDRFKVVYGTAGRPCPRCGAASLIRARGQGDDNRTTYWCPRCQR